MLKTFATTFPSFSTKKPRRTARDIPLSSAIFVLSFQLHSGISGVAEEGFFLLSPTAGPLAGADTTTAGAGAVAVAVAGFPLTAAAGALAGAFTFAGCFRFAALAACFAASRIPSSASKDRLTSQVSREKSCFQFCSSRSNCGVDFPGLSGFSSFQPKSTWRRSVISWNESTSAPSTHSHQPRWLSSRRCSTPAF